MKFDKLGIITQKYLESALRELKEELGIQAAPEASVLFLHNHICVEKMKNGALRHCIYEDEFAILGEKLGLV